MRREKSLRPYDLGDFLAALISIKYLNSERVIDIIYIRLQCDNERVGIQVLCNLSETVPGL